MDISGVSWGNLLTLLGILVAFYFSSQSSKRAAAESERQVLALHSQNVARMAKFEAIVETHVTEIRDLKRIIYEWMADQNRRRGGD